MIIKENVIKYPDNSIKTIRNKVVSCLYKYLEVPVVMLEQTENKPPYPFVGYKFTATNISDGTLGVHTADIVPSTNKKFESDIEEVVYYQPQVRLSITAYSEDDIDTEETIKKAYDWFKHVGYYDLQDINTVVVKVSDITPRNTLIVGDYERKSGFDVTIRTVDVIRRRLEIIESVSTKNRR